MLISELQAQLEEIKQEHGDLLLRIERPSGVFVEINGLYKTFILRLDDDGESLTGCDHLVIKSYV